MSRNEVDSTVLLLAVIAGVVALLLIPPGHVWLCGVAGLILLLTLFAFDLEGVRSVLQSFAFAAVCGFSLAVAIAPLAPTLFSLTGPTDPLLGGKWLPIVWLGSTVLFVVIDRARMSGRVPVERSAVAARPSLRVNTMPVQAPMAGPLHPVAPPPPPSPPPPASAPAPVLVREEPTFPPPPPETAPVAPTRSRADSVRQGDQHLRESDGGRNEPAAIGAGRAPGQGLLPDYRHDAAR